MLPDNLPAWLMRLESTHNTAIDLSLTRMQQALIALDLQSLNVPVITIAGTNGKGSVVCALETIYHTAGYRVGSYTSPHLFTFNERIKINTVMLNDEKWCQAFAAVYAIAQQFQLTYFEAITLAAFWVFKHTALDIIILEVGLGGRLDAVNAIDPVLSIITSIDLDHTDRLGNTREAIAKEKAGIFRKNVPVICGDPNPPPILKKLAEKLHAPFYQSCQIDAPLYKGGDLTTENNLLPENMHTAVAAIRQLQNILPVSEVHIHLGLKNCHLPGRQQILYDKCKHLIDVAHNPAGIKKLAERINCEKNTGKVLLVISMLADKDITTSFAALKKEVDVWFVAPIQNTRSADLAYLQTIINQLEISTVNYFAQLMAAYQAALDQARADDLIVITGSFYTVAEVFNDGGVI